MDDDLLIKIKASDGKVVEITKKAIFKSGLLKGIMEDYPDNTEFPLNQVNGAILEKIKEYLIHYQDIEPEKIEIPLKSINFKESVSEWDYNYLGDNIDLIFQILNASNYMDIKPLFELVSAKLGSKIKGITSEKVKNDFEIPEPNEEEQEQIIKDKIYLEQNL